MNHQPGCPRGQSAGSPCSCPRALDNLDVRTTAGEPFTGRDHARLALLVYRRFGRNAASATAAWRRMLENNCPERDFMALVDAGFALDGAEATRPAATTPTLTDEQIGALNYLRLVEDDPNSVTWHSPHTPETLAGLTRLGYVSPHRLRDRPGLDLRITREGREALREALAR